MSATDETDENTGVAILDRVMQPDDSALTHDAARMFLSLRFPKRDERRMNQLAAKGRRAALTGKERHEAEQYNLVSHLIAFLQARARRTLKRPNRRSESA